MSGVKEQSVRTVTIANGASQSGAISLGAYRLGGIIMPAAWTTAAITFLVCDTVDGTFVPLHDDVGTEVTIAAAAVAASRAIAIDELAGSLAQWEWVRLRSGTTSAAVNQAAARTLKLVLKR